MRKTAPFRLHIDSVQQDLRVLSFSGTEAINEPFAFHVAVTCSPGSLNIADLLYQPAFLRLAESEHGIHGLISKAGMISAAGEPGHYLVTLSPHLATLAQSARKRIFQNMSAPQVISCILQEQGLVQPSYLFQLSGNYPLREHCVQYDESNLHFIHRLCEEEGMHYRFEHSRNSHRLVFNDNQTFRRIPAQQFGSPGTAAVQRFEVKVDDDISLPIASATGQSNQPYLASGHLMPLQGHIRPECNSLWLLTEIDHHYHQDNPPDLYNSHYSNHFRARAWDRSLTPRNKYPKPRIHGLHLARVIDHDPASVERVKVRLDWDQGENAVCWAALSKSAAWNMASLPAMGTQLYVCFVEGDPDRPLVRTP